MTQAILLLLAAVAQKRRRYEKQGPRNAFSVKRRIRGWPVRYPAGAARPKPRARAERKSRAKLRETCASVTMSNP